jgi:hypothetical protein
MNLPYVAGNMQAATKQAAWQAQSVQARWHHHTQPLRVSARSAHHRCHALSRAAAKDAAALTDREVQHVTQQWVRVAVT